MLKDRPFQKPCTAIVLALVLTVAFGVGAAAAETAHTANDVNILEFLPEEEVILYSPPIVVEQEEEVIRYSPPIVVEQEEEIIRYSPGIYVNGTDGGGLSTEAQALVAGRTAEEQPVAQRGLAFTEAVLANDTALVARYIHPEIMEYGALFGMTQAEIADSLIEFVYYIVGPNPTGYERINIDLWSWGGADCDVYFQVAEDFLVVEMEPYNGVFYVVNVY